MFECAGAQRVAMIGAAIPFVAEEARTDYQQSYCAEDEECQDVESDSFRSHNVVSWKVGAG